MKNGEISTFAVDVSFIGRLCSRWAIVGFVKHLCKAIYDSCWHLATRRGEVYMGGGLVDISSTIDHGLERVITMLKGALPVLLCGWLLY